MFVGCLPHEIKFLLNRDPCALMLLVQCKERRFPVSFHMHFLETIIYKECILFCWHLYFHLFGQLKEAFKGKIFM